MHLTSTLFFLYQLSYKSIVLANVSVKEIATNGEKKERIEIGGVGMVQHGQRNSPIQLMFVCSK